MSTSSPRQDPQGVGHLGGIAAAVKGLAEVGAAVPGDLVTTEPVFTPKPVTLLVAQPEQVPIGEAPTSRPISEPVLLPAGGATGRNTAQQNHTFGKTNPRRTAGLKPRQVAAARLLFAGRGVAEVAAEIEVHPYTISRSKRDRGSGPSCAGRSTAPRRATPRNKNQHPRNRRRGTKPFGDDAGLPRRPGLFGNPEGSGAARLSAVEVADAA